MRRRAFGIALAAVLGVLAGGGSAEGQGVLTIEPPRDFMHHVTAVEGGFKVWVTWNINYPWDALALTVTIPGQDPEERWLPHPDYDAMVAGSWIVADPSQCRFEIRSFLAPDMYSDPIVSVPYCTNRAWENLPDLPALSDFSCSYDPETGHVALTWSISTVYSQIKIWRLIDHQPKGGHSISLPGDATSWTDETLPPGTDLSKVFYGIRGEMLDPCAEQLVQTTNPPRSCELSGNAHLPFVRGDANRDGIVSISDAATATDYMFKRWGSLPCRAAADVDDSDGLDLTDVASIIMTLYMGGPIFPEPYPMAAVHEHPDSLTCNNTVGAAPALDERFVIEVGSVYGVPGTTIAVPVYATTPVAVDAESLALTFDPAKVRIEESTVEEALAGTIFEEVMTSPEFTYYMSWIDASGGRAGVGILNHWARAEGNLPPMDRALLLNLKVTILPDAPEGETEIVPENGIGDPPISNEYSVLGAAVYAATLPALKKGRIGINVPGNFDFFRRGDANADAALDISDPVEILYFLFIDGLPPACERAADANDDGQVDIADPITILESLFLGAPSRLPEPSARCAPLPRDGRLECAATGCP
jgi:hypothetical protein